MPCCAILCDAVRCYARLPPCPPPVVVTTVSMMCMYVSMYECKCITLCRVLPHVHIYLYIHIRSSTLTDQARSAQGSGSTSRRTSRRTSTGTTRLVVAVVVVVFSVVLVVALVVAPVVVLLVIVVVVLAVVQWCCWWWRRRCRTSLHSDICMMCIYVHIQIAHVHIYTYTHTHIYMYACMKARTDDLAAIGSRIKRSTSGRQIRAPHRGDSFVLKFLSLHANYFVHLDLSHLPSVQDLRSESVQSAFRFMYHLKSIVLPRSGWACGHEKSLISALFNDQCTVAFQ